MVVARKWMKARDFSGPLSDADFRLEEETLPPLKDGDVLFEATYLTVDPYMRMFRLPAGNQMFGQQVARVTESKDPSFPVGSEWLCRFGWRTHTVYNKKTAPPNVRDMVAPLPDLKGVPHSLALGTVGMPGVTAHIGLLDTAELKSGDVVLVNGAAGAVGSVVGQIAKIKGCTVIGYAGSDEKVRWIKEELGFDFAFNYKKVDLSESLKKAAPEGVDVYFDNVGGSFSDTVIPQHVKKFGRIAIIGSIAGYETYNPAEPPKGAQLYITLLSKGLTMRGMEVPDFPKERWLQAYKDLSQWVREGKLKYREHVTVGFDQMPRAFMGLFKGDNIGKAVVKVNEDSKFNVKM